MEDAHNGLRWPPSCKMGTIDRTSSSSAVTAAPALPPLSLSSYSLPLVTVATFSSLPTAYDTIQLCFSNGSGHT